MKIEIGTDRKVASAFYIGIVSSIRKFIRFIKSPLIERKKERKREKERERERERERLSKFIKL